MADDRSRDIVPGEAESQGAVLVVWGGNGDGVAGSPSTDSEREGIWRDVALGKHSPW